jgi:hypothetical protein
MGGNVGRAAQTRSRLFLWATMVLAALLIPGATSAQADSVTDVTAVMPAAAADIQPGLCGPEDTPLCVGPYEAQIHLYSLSCTATGTFEGSPLTADSRCGIDLSAFMVPSVDGLTKPSCVTAHTYTSDDARTHGKPVNETVAGGVARKMQLSYPFGVLNLRTGTGWVDGPDSDDDPIGDHSLVFSIQVRPRETEPGELPCITAPFTAASLTAVMRIFDGPAAASD